MSKDRILIQESVPTDSPPTGHSFIYVDSSDGLIKEKDDAGNIETYYPETVKDFTPFFREGDTASYTYTTQTGRSWKFGNLVKARFALEIDTVSGSSNDGMFFKGLPYTIDTTLVDRNHLWIEVTRLVNITNFTDHQVGKMYVTNSSITSDRVRLHPESEPSLNAGTILEGVLYYHTDE